MKSCCEFAKTLYAICKTTAVIFQACIQLRNIRSKELRKSDPDFSLPKSICGQHNSQLNTPSRTYDHRLLHARAVLKLSYLNGQCLSFTVN